MENLLRTWESGERHLMAGRYVAARTLLESAEAMAWRRRDAGALARIYLPLLEARRQIRHLAVEGAIHIASSGMKRLDQLRLLRAATRLEAAVVLLALPAGLALAAAVGYESRRTGRCTEALVLATNGLRSRLTTPADPTFAAGLPVVWARDPGLASTIEESTDPGLTVSLPAPGIHGEGPAHAMARESLLIAWEALALRWQQRHPPSRDTQTDPWQELCWLRRGLLVDPACEPIIMRLIALAQGVERKERFSGSG